MDDADLRGALKVAIDDWLDTIPVTSLAPPNEDEVLILVECLMELLRRRTTATTRWWE